MEGDNDEEAIKNKEQEIMELGEKLKKEKKPQELAQLIRNVRPFLSMISKAKAAKLVRGLVDLFLDMEASIGTEVELCKVKCIFLFLKLASMLMLSRNASTGLLKRRGLFSDKAWKHALLPSTLTQSSTLKPYSWVLLYLKN